MTISIKKPQVGDPVLFSAPLPGMPNPDILDEYAGTVTRVSVNNDGVIDLVTFGANSMYFQHQIPHNVEGYPGSQGSWRYPSEAARFKPIEDDIEVSQ